MLTTLLLTVLLAVPPAMDLSQLSPAQREIFHHVTQDEFCSCDSAMTVEGCLQLRPNCEIAQHLGVLVGRAAGADNTAPEISGYLSEQVMGPYCSTPKQFDTKLAPSKGASHKKATITVVEFADFRCGHCKHAAQTVAAVSQQFGKDVRFVYMPFPLQNNPLGVAAAEASLEAKAQGKFWPMHDALFALQGEDFSQKVIEKAARKAGLNLAKLRAALASHKYKSQVLALKAQGEKAGVDSTPAFFVNGRRYQLDTELFTLPARLVLEKARHKGNCQ